ncbi:hypothetical protein [Pseudomonas phage Teru]|nr:hypothetical protein [Pseudomonas phage Teru]
MSVIGTQIGFRKNQIKAPEHHEELPAVASFGFEVELEGLDQWPEVAGWDIKNDGSLRNGMEYVFSGPASGEQAINRVEAFANTMEQNPPAPTFRCSTHLHMDMRDVNWKVYERTVLAYMVFEDVFFDHCQPYRRDSNFCIPFFSNDWLSQTFGRRILAPEGDREKVLGLTSWPKYSALNLQVTHNFGSIEFRGAHAMTTRSEMVGLMQRMMCLKAFAIAHEETPLGEFVKVLSDVNLRDIFFLGVAPDYEMSPGGREMGIASASLAVATMGFVRSGVDPLEDEQNRQRRLREQAREQQRALDRRLMAARSVMGRIREGSPERYNLAIIEGNNMRMDQVLTTVQSLRMIGHQVSVRDLVEDNEILRDSFVLLLDNPDHMQRHAGFRLEENMY